MPTVNQSSNQVNRRLGVLERRLKQKLLTFYQKHIKGSQAPIQTIRQRYGKEIEELVRNNVQTSWLFANDITSDRLDVTINLSTKDIDGIERVSTEMTNQFWTTAGKNLKRETEFKVSENNVLEHLPEFALPAAMLSVSSLMLYFAFNHAMQSKSEELGTKLKFVVRDDCIDTKICLPLNGQIFEVGQVQYNPPLHRHCHCKLIPVSA